MSNHSPLSNESITPSGAEAKPKSEGRCHRLVRSLKKPAEFLAFWVAITLPFVHLPLLARGLGDPNVSLAFLLLLVINVSALYVGHGYNQE
ncbi:hypothetical protein CV102_04900 [Natronococcus pandeyae]|uniref:Uncharacterized protein n=1 Tax=Natronococcus pandeyae TaxID=2055836 RepID=A0A8J8Q979_9EURY|nr:hypothetical protein [Natronococcus pandeyae]TYL39630.1 hypothetical protein CV102_04900 [Natronococcus pandeyae]